MTILNANEYITKGEAVQVLHTAYAEGRIQAKDGCASVLDDIGALKAADVQPVKHGHWYDNTYRYIGELDAYFIQACCSCCNRYSDKLDQYTKIMSNETCSHCGADMRGEQNEDN